MKRRGTKDTGQQSSAGERPTPAHYDAAIGLPVGQRNQARRDYAAEHGEPGTPQPACGRKGCHRPWAEHLTAKGNLRVWAKEHRQAGAETAESMRRYLRRAGRQLVVGRVKSMSARKKAPASFQTHIIVVTRGGAKIRMTRSEYDAMNASLRGQ